MKLILMILTLAASLAAQTPGTVDVQLSVTAKAGVLTCTITPKASTYTLACSTPTWTLPPIAVTPEPGSADAVTLQVNKGADVVTLILSQTTTNRPVNWSVAANGVTKNGAF